MESQGVLYDWSNSQCYISPPLGLDHSSRVISLKTFLCLFSSNLHMCLYLLPQHKAFIPSPDPSINPLGFWFFFSTICLNLVPLLLVSLVYLCVLTSSLLPLCHFLLHFPRPY